LLAGHRLGLWLVRVNADILGWREPRRIWTAGELSALMALPDLTPKIVQRLALAKRAVDGDIVDVRRPRPARARSKRRLLSW